MATNVPEEHRDPLRWNKNFCSSREQAAKNPTEIVHSGRDGASRYFLCGSGVLFLGDKIGEFKAQGGNCAQSVFEMHQDQNIPRRVRQRGMRAVNAWLRKVEKDGERRDAGKVLRSVALFRGKRRGHKRGDNGLEPGSVNGKNLLETENEIHRSGHRSHRHAAGRTGLSRAARAWR